MLLNDQRRALVGRRIGELGTMPRGGIRDPETPLEGGVSGAEGGTRGRLRRIPGRVSEAWFQYDFPADSLGPGASARATAEVDHLALCEFRFNPAGDSDFIPATIPI